MISTAHDYVVLLDAVVAIIILFSGRMIHLSIMQIHLPAPATFFKYAHEDLVTQQYSKQFQASTSQQQKITGYWKTRNNGRTEYRKNFQLPEIKML